MYEHGSSSWSMPDLRPVSQMSFNSRASNSSKASMAARKAVLLAEAAMLKERQKLDYEELLLRQKREFLELNAAIARATAEEEARAKFDSTGDLANGFNDIQINEIGDRGPNVSQLNAAAEAPVISSNVQLKDVSDGNVNSVAPCMQLLYDTGSTMPKEVVVAEASRKLSAACVMAVGDADSNKADEVVDVGGSSFVDGTKQLASLIYNGQECQQRMLESLQLPKAELSTFNGDPLNYWIFMRAFDNCVGRTRVDDAQKLTRLLHYCNGKALRVIQCCAAMEPSAGYEKARYLLNERFGNKYVVTEAWIKKVTEGPVISNQDREGLQDLADCLRNCMETLQAMKNVGEINVQSILVKIVERLPVYMQIRWRKEVREIKRRWDRAPNIVDVVGFVEEGAEEANDPVYGKVKDVKNKHVVNSDGNSRFGVARKRSTSFAVSSESKEPYHNAIKSALPGDSHIKTCPLCAAEHALYQCRQFLAMNGDERMTFVKNKRLCFNCLKEGHTAAQCKSPRTCSVSGCGGKHTKFLHRNKMHDHSGERNVDHPTGNEATRTERTSTFHNITGAGATTALLPIVPVLVKAAGRTQSIRTFALLDNGSTSTFCSTELLEQLQISGEAVSIALTTIEKADELVKSEVVRLRVADLNENVEIDMPMVFTRPVLPIPAASVIGKIKNKWDHLCDIDIPALDADRKVNLLIGQDVPQALMPLEVRKGGKHEPYAVRTALGWTINGPIEQQSRRVISNFLLADGHCMRNLEQQVERFWKIESCEDDYLSMSISDKRVIEYWQESISLVNGHYQLPIPVKKNATGIPNNYMVAERRLQNLYRRMKDDPTLFNSYCAGMRELINKGFAEKLSESGSNSTSHLIWYLPHHGVTHPLKPGKLRIVFDCAAKHQGISLNDVVNQGPDLTNKLVGVLLRFRLENVAIMADIESMYYQVMVSPDDRDLLRFLWWSDGKADSKPDVYRMTVHVFGGVWSPSCANFALRYNAEQNAERFGQDIVECVNRNFYVDDFLKSVRGDNEAIYLMRQLTELLKCGGFRLTKWLSNSREVLQAVPECERAKEFQELDLSRESLPTERALGICWNVDTDELFFRTNIKNKPATRRGMLSVVSSIYDPLGLLSPCILPAKLIMQDLCRMKFGWDNLLTSNELQMWQRWIETLPKMNQFVIQRCIKPADFGEVKSQGLHHFCDASVKGYGTASYLRMVNQQGRVHCTLIMGKSRLAPIKNMTIPRLELSAAALAVKVDRLLQSELDLVLEESVFWTDSMIVISYINNVDKRFHTFVANRVSAIHNGSKPSQWRHVRTELNPADDVSRGMTMDEFINSQRWLTGPSFLLNEQDIWPVMPKVVNDVADLEIKCESKLCLTTYNADDVMHRLFCRPSTWYKLKKLVAWILRAKSRLRDKINKRESMAIGGVLSVKEIRDAETAIVKYVQYQSFKSEIKMLCKKQNTEDAAAISSSMCKQGLNAIYKLDPFLGDNGIMYVGGRLRNAPISEEMKHPIILPSKHPVNKLIINQYHVMSGHAGREHTMSMLREKFWIIGGRREVRTALNSCYLCRRQTASTMNQKMADLPVDRVTPSKAPFVEIGVDYFGPFLVKQARSMVKRYGCLFTCLTTRAVHIEIAHSMDTDSFINALERFMCRRGQPEVIRSDNGTNFTGAERELKEAIRQWNQRQVTEFLRQKEVVWKFNPPAASHMGGIWERIIRSVRKVLNSLMKQQVVNDEVLLTLMCQVESILNSRPITAVSDDPRDPEALTPNHLLLIRKNLILPLGEFDQRDAYRRRWKQVQYLSNVFWRRWINEYLPTLQMRQRWARASRNIKVGDVVIMTDEHTPRNMWPLAKVVEVYPGHDGLTRTVKVRSKCSEFVRPVHKLCNLETVD